MVLRILVVLYLIYLATMLWYRGANEMGGAGPVTFQRVLVTTLLKPKAIIFAFALQPPIAETTMINLLPWLLALALHIFIIGGCWMAAGASLPQGLQGYVDSKLGYWASAAVLLLLAGGISAHAVVMA
jgi:threonine/homoserine/homoserine lactone efflux protein